jgi:hypothetical protein
VVVGYRLWQRLRDQRTDSTVNQYASELADVNKMFRVANIHSFLNSSPRAILLLRGWISILKVNIGDAF